MMGLFLLVIFTQATRAGNNSKAETFPLGRREGAAVRTLVAAARAPAGGKELSRDRTGHQAAHLWDAALFGVSPLVTASPARESKSFGSTYRREHKTGAQQRWLGCIWGTSFVSCR